jgi:hypothetical protein
MRNLRWRSLWPYVLALMIGLPLVWASVSHWRAKERDILERNRVVELESRPALSTDEATELLVLRRRIAERDAAAAGKR